ncbi:MAG: hypothetical protein U0Q55_16155 [Vicinamibacterales bacterium]
MAKTQARTAAKSAGKTKVAVRKVAIKDLDAKKRDDVKGGSYSVIQRCR